MAILCMRKENMINKLFEELSSVNVNDKTENKNGLTYLSWAWAWSELKKKCPNAYYEIERFGEEKKPYLYDEDLGYMVFTKLTIDGLTHEMWLPVMDGNNKAMKKDAYQYKVKNPNFKYAKKREDGVYRDNRGNEQKEFLIKTVNPATMFDINKTIMRCLTKNISMFGLGLYIYAGEDLPESLNEEVDEEAKEKAKQEDKQPIQLATENQVRIIRSSYTEERLAKMLSYYKVNNIEDLSIQQASEAIKNIKKG